MTVERIFKHVCCLLTFSIEKPFWCLIFFPCTDRMDKVSSAYLWDHPPEKLIDMALNDIFWVGTYDEHCIWKTLRH